MNVMIKLITNILKMKVFYASDVYSTFKAEISITQRAKHFIASFRPLYWNEAFWTLFNSVITTQEVFKYLATRLILMGLIATFKTDFLRAHSTSTYSSSLIWICNNGVAIRTNAPNRFFICLNF